MDIRRDAWGFGLAVASVFLVAALVELPATDNPTDEYVRVRYMYNEQPFTGQKWFYDSGFRVLNSGWCEENHRTPAPAERKFDHVHAEDETGDGFPFIHENPLYGNVEVTRDMADAGWDYDYFIPMDQGWERTSHADCRYNCHGEATGFKTVLLASTMYGMGRHLEDAGWEVVDHTKQESQVGSGMIVVMQGYQHSYVIDSAQWNGLFGTWMVVEKHEKRDSSGTYKLDMGPLGRAPYGTVYKKVEE